MQTKGQHKCIILYPDKMNKVNLHTQHFYGRDIKNRGSFNTNHIDTFL